MDYRLHDIAPIDIDAIFGHPQQDFTSSNPMSSPAKADTPIPTRQPSSSIRRFLMSRPTQNTSTNSQNATVIAARKNIDDLATQLGEANKKIETLTQENVDSKREQLEKATLLELEIEDLEEKNLNLESQLTASTQARTRLRKALAYRKRAQSTHEKALGIAKTMASWNQRTTFKKFLDTQVEFGKALEESKKVGEEVVMEWTGD